MSREERTVQELRAEKNVVPIKKKKWKRWGKNVIEERRRQ